MLRKLLAIVTLALGLHISVAYADECVEVDSFSRAFAAEGIHLLGSKAAATEKMLRVFNANREAVGQPKAEISVFLFGLIKNASGDFVAVVAAFDKNGCVMQKTVTVITAKQWIDFMNAAGVTIHDFAPMDGAQ